MDAHVGTQEAQFVADMATDAVKGFWFVVITILVYIGFVPWFVYGLGVSLWEAANVSDRVNYRYGSLTKSQSELARTNS